MFPISNDDLAQLPPSSVQSGSSLIELLPFALFLLGFYITIYYLSIFLLTILSLALFFINRHQFLILSLSIIHIPLLIERLSVLFDILFVIIFKQKVTLPSFIT